MIYNLYIFNREGRLIYYKEWNRSRAPDVSLEDDQRLMSGLLYSLKMFAARISPMEGDEFSSYATSTYKCHFFEAPTGLRFALNTDPDTADLHEGLKFIYSNFYSEFVLRNPLCEPHKTIECALFDMSVDRYITDLTAYST